MLEVVSVVLLVMQGLGVGTSQSSTASSTAGSLDDASSSSSSFRSFEGSDVGFVNVTTKAEELAQEWFTANFADNQTQLAVGVSSALSNLTDSDIICYGVPSLQRRTVETLPNFGCPDIYTAVDASCSCLTPGFNDTDTWEFHVTQRDNESEYPTTLNATRVLPIDAIRTMVVPSTLKTLYVSPIF
ncbi:hypothetical protein BBJ28_00018775 [Nothophytophthora sp. Chile5]|nr:hypothetical protein BBJ28_00018775 [Nothophytophthora sp. Chile5]